jgi:hypothetical protein
LENEKLRQELRELQVDFDEDDFRELLLDHASPRLTTRSRETLLWRRIRFEEHLRCDTVVGRFRRRLDRALRRRLFPRSRTTASPTAQAR